MLEPEGQPHPTPEPGGRQLPPDEPRPDEPDRVMTVPNALSVVRLLGVEGNVLSVRGIDCLDGTPLIDLKPYFASTDAVPDAVVGWHRDRQA